MPPALARAVMLTVPSPRVSSSVALRLTTLALVLPSTLLSTRPWLVLKVSATVLPVSAMTLTAPARARAAFSEALATISTGADSSVVLSVKLTGVASVLLPARSLALALTLTVPCPSMMRSTLLSVTARAAPVPVRYLSTV